MAQIVIRLSSEIDHDMKIYNTIPNKIDKKWFELCDLPSILNKKIWIPLRVTEKISTGEYGYAGFKEIFFGLGSVAIPVSCKEEAMKLGWEDIGISHSHSGFYDDRENIYIPADVYKHHQGNLQGLHLVLETPGNSLEKTQWEPNQDLTVTLGLTREGDTWLSPSEGYVEVIKFTRDKETHPARIEIKADYLVDYLCARNMGLYATFYTSRSACFESDPNISWKSEKETPQQRSNGRWKGRAWPIHEGGHPYGEKWAVFHVARTDPVEVQDIPDISTPPTDDNTLSDQWERGFKGKKLYKVMGEFWGSEWLEPGNKSKRVKGDKVSSSTYFITDEKGTKTSGDDLIDNGKWLWFKPDVIMALSHRRGGSLKWYTRNTGEVACSPHYGVHFGVNDLGLVNVFANDIGLLPEWQQQIWVGHNTSPDGGVSAELLASQVKANPAKTQAPEEFLKLGIKAANYFAKQKLGIDLFINHEAIPEILEKTHRFRALDKAGLFSLAKDIARITADSINTQGLYSIAFPPKGKKLGSLKSLEFLLTTKVGINKASLIMAPLFNVYDLRLGDAHLPSIEIDDVFLSLRIDTREPFVQQGSQMLHSVVSALYKIIDILKSWDK